MQRQLKAGLPHLTTKVGGYDLLVLILLIIGAALRFQGLHWDEGLMLHPDERNIAQAAAALAYPQHLDPEFYAYNGLAIFLPRLLAEFLSVLGIGSGTNVSDVAYAARLLSASFSSLASVVMVWAAFRYRGRDMARTVAFAAAFAPALVQAAHFGTTESSLVLVISVIMLISILQIEGRISAGTAAWTYGLALGIGLGFKLTAIAFGLIPFVTMLLLLRVSGMRATVLHLAVIAIVALGVFSLTTPYLFTNAEAFLNVVRFEGHVVDGSADVFWTYQFQHTVDGVFELSQLPWLLDPVSAALALAGLSVTIFRGARLVSPERELLPSAIFAIAYMLIIFSWHAKFIRYQLPLMPLYIFSASFMLGSLRENLGNVSRRVLLGGFVFSVSFAGLSQASIYQHTDPRVASWAWLAPQLKNGDSLVVEPVETGAPFAIPNGLQIEVLPLPLIDPSGPQKIASIADILGRGEWMLISSRRHYRVLPSMHDRFPEMCNYYRTLWNGELGYKMVTFFTRRSGVFGSYDPTARAEETFSVFDNPKVYILHNEGKLSAGELAIRIAEKHPDCIWRSNGL